MIVTYLFSIIFIAFIAYGLIRPFSSIFLKLFFILGSLFGLLSVLGSEYTNQISTSLGIGRGADLYLYIGLVCSFLFVFYTQEKFNLLDQKIKKMAKVVSLLEKNRN